MLLRPRRPAAPGDAVDLLLECHERIRAMVALAERLAAARGEPPESLAEAASRVHRYFTLALPLHALDEEVSLLPRLRGRSAALDGELAAMAREHRDHERPVGALVAACARIAHDPACHPEFAHALAAAAAELGQHFEAHLTREEAIIFPAVRRLLDAETLALVASEMRSRRQGQGGATDPGKPPP